MNMWVKPSFWDGFSTFHLAANLVIQQRSCSLVCQVCLWCKFLGEDGFKESVKARVVWGRPLQRNLGFYILWNWFWHDLRGNNDISGTILYVFVNNFVNDMYIQRYSYVIAAALSDTKWNMSLDNSVARGWISVVHRHGHWTQSNSIIPKSSITNQGCVHICTYERN